MPTVDERLKQVTSKVKRAKEHISDLEREHRAFFDSQPYEVGTKRDPQSRKLIYYLTRIDPVPECLALIAGDAVQNLMSALDHLAYQIVCSDTGDDPPNPNWIYFPIADDAAKYEAKKRGKMEGASQESFDAIDTLKPYKGGNDLLWILYRLNNIEKHRLLFTVGSKAAGVDFMQAMIRGMFPDGEPVPPGLEGAKAQMEKMTLIIMPANTGFPLKDGFELFADEPDAEPNPKQQFRFAVALHEPGVVDGKPILETLHQLTTLVEGIVAALAPRLK